MRFLKREKAVGSAAYAISPPYAQARSELLARRPADAPPEVVPKPGPVPEPGSEPVPAAARVWAVVVDLGLDHYLVTVFAFADGTIAIHGSGGVHSTGLRGAERVAAAAALLLEDVEAALGSFARVADAADCPLPGPGGMQIIARTLDGDLVATGRLPPRGGPLVGLTAIAFHMIDAAHEAAVEGFEPAEAGDFVYRVAPAYRSVRRTFLDWEERPDPASHGRVSSVAVEYGEGQVVTSLFAFARGWSTSLYSSDGSVALRLTDLAGAGEATRGLLECVEERLPQLTPATVVRLPQPGQVQFVARTLAGPGSESQQLRASASADILAAGRHPLSSAYVLANELRRIANEPVAGEGDEEPG